MYGYEREIEMKGVSDEGKKEDNGFQLDDGKNGRLLLNIANKFSNIHNVGSLAASLLEGVGNGPEAFMQTFLGQHHNRPSGVAFSVLRVWCQQKPYESFSGTLYNTLKKESVNPAAAREFRDLLLPNA